ncbi:MAG: hypothetical protein RJQ09_13035 [Cyclobacteriaceae bacterium]
MITITALWLPILLSAVLVFIISSIIHTILPFHKKDYEKLPHEADIMKDLEKYQLQPGDYFLPKPDSSAEMKSEEYKAKMDKGPVAFMTVYPNGQFNMGSSLIQWFIYCIIISVFAAYVASRALGPEAYYLDVFRFVGAVSFMGYSAAIAQNSIWSKRKWSTSIRFIIDGFIYALFTAGTFGWLWPN